MREDPTGPRSKDTPSAEAIARRMTSYYSRKRDGDYGKDRGRGRDKEGPGEVVTTPERLAAPHSATGVGAETGPCPGGATGSA